MNISVVIPSYNTQDIIAKTLQQLTEQTTTASYDIIVVDCSEHDLVKNVVSQFSKARYEHRNKRFNPGEGRNIGAHIAQGELLVFVDADVQLAAEALDKAWSHFQEGHEIFGGALELNTDVCSDSAAYLEHYFFNHEAQSHRPACERSNLSSALMCFKREVFIHAGGFKDIPRMQDTELTERLKREGHKLYFFPDILGYQTQDSPLSKVLRKIYINGQNLYYIRYQATVTRRKRLLFFLLIPAISLAKALRIIARHLMYQSWPNRLRTIVFSPLILLSDMYWMFGFYHALITEKGVSKER